MCQRCARNAAVLGAAEREDGEIEARLTRRFVEQESDTLQISDAVYGKQSGRQAGTRWYAKKSIYSYLSRARLPR